MIIQTLALLLDAYRELQSKKMFWAVLIINFVVIAGFGLLHIDQDSLKVLWYQVNVPRPIYIYKQIFSNGIVGVWFTWLATLLALISTAGMFPDFLTAGAVDLYLAKPISRLRLFFTKYLAGMIFVTLQVTVFTVMSFLVLGFRGGLWEPGLFWAIPLIVIFFSYLFAICVFFGVLSRSVISALLFTLLAWVLIWGVDITERFIVENMLRSESAAAALDDQIAIVEKQIQDTQSDPNHSEAALKSLQDRHATAMTARAAADVTPGVVVTERVLYAIKSVTPKTRETTNLLDRYLFSDKEMQDTIATEAAPAPQPAFRNRPMRQSNVAARLELERQRSPWWIIGTSLIFEAVVLALAAWYFCTRDF